MSKLLVFLYAGGSAAGKTTTTKQFAVGNPDEHCEVVSVPTRKGMEDKKVYWTEYDNCATCGSHKAGADSNNGPGAIKAAFHRCLRLSDTILVDGKINSPQWVEMVNSVACDYDDVLIVTLYYQLSAETLLQRLAGRRGVGKESIRESMFKKCQVATGRATLLVNNVKKLATTPYEIVNIGDDMTTDDIVYIMDDIVMDYFGGD